MNQNRVNNIKKVFDGVGPVKNKEYTNQEIVDLLMEIQKTMMSGVYEKTHAEYMKERDLMRHFATLATEYGLHETDTYKRFEANMSELGFTIGSFIKGMNGERIAKRALKLISFDKDVRILYNIALEDEDAQAEYDAIVITPYGLFVIEVKNWGAEMIIDENGILRREDQNIKYDLPGRMSIKEGLLREYLEDLFPETYQSILLFSNENANVHDEYKKMPICYGGGVTYMIREQRSEGRILTVEQIDSIVERIVASHKEQKAPCKVKCEEIIDDYAELMASIEEMSECQNSGIQVEVHDCEEESNTSGNETLDKKTSEKKEQVLREVNFSQRIGRTVAGLALVFSLGVATTRIIKGVGVSRI